MFLKNESVNGFLWIKFHERPIVDYRKKSTKQFDLTSKEYPDYPSDFLVNGSFDDCQYCMCLMDMAFSLPAQQLSSFFDYQCGQLDKPYPWLVQFDSLLNYNSNSPFIKPFIKRLDLLILLLEERRDEYSGYVQKRRSIFDSVSLEEVDDRFTFSKVREELEAIRNIDSKKRFLFRCRADYLQEVKNDNRAKFIRNIDLELEYLENIADLEDKDTDKDIDFKKIVFKGTPTELANKFGQLYNQRNEDGESFFDASTSTYARLICNNHCQPDGGPFKETSIRKFLTNFKNGNQSSRNK